nr:immunoglobulin light chain junction region [Macaca mulatta]
CMRGLEFPYSF